MDHHREANARRSKEPNSQLSNAYGGEGVFLVGLKKNSCRSGSACIFSDDRDSEPGGER